MLRFVSWDLARKHGENNLSYGHQKEVEGKIEFFASNEHLAKYGVVDYSAGGPQRPTKYEGLCLVSYVTFD